jgi:hypothetical protein
VAAALRRGGDQSRQRPPAVADVGKRGRGRAGVERDSRAVRAPSSSAANVSATARSSSPCRSMPRAPWERIT